MSLLKARTGWDWILNGLTLFRKRPFFLTNLLFVYLIGMMLLSVIPFVGRILPVLISPVFTFLFMYACFSIDVEERIAFRELFHVLNRTITLRLIMVGGVYLLFALFVAGVLFLFSRNSFDELSSPGLVGVFIVSGLIFIAYIPFAMATWFAVPLIGWKNMSPGKALFYSFFTVAREYRPFVVYVLCWMFGFTLLSFVSGVLNSLMGQSVSAFVTFVLSIIMLVSMYCSFYFTYRDIFGCPDSKL